MGQRGLFILILLCSPACPITAFGTTELSGTVTAEGTGLPLEGVVVGVTRWSQAESTPPGAAIPVEASTATDAAGHYRFDIDETLPGVDRLVVFTWHQTVANELFGGVDTRGMTPRRRDLDEPGVLFINLTTGPATTVDFQVGSNRTNHRVLMRDGMTHLGTDVWLPSRRPGMAWPVLMVRTPYSRPGPDREFIQGDYAVVVQSTRGREDSEGVDGVFDDDGWGTNQDGYDGIEWAAAQPWSLGKVCTYGGSAPGITQYRAAGAGPPHLICAVAEIATANPYHDMTFPGGEWLKNLVEVWLEGQGSIHKLEEYWAHPNEDGYWTERNLLARASSVTLPILHIGGWYDIFTQGTLAAFGTLNENGGEGARRNQKLVMGPWIHGWYGSQYQGMLIYPPQSLFSDYSGTRMRWFDFWLKGQDTGIMDEPPVRAYVMGPGLPEGGTGPGNFWRTADGWPPPSTRTAYFLQPNGTLTKSPPGEGGGETSFQHDPENPVPTQGGNNLYFDIGIGPYDQRVIDNNRSDVKVWQTAVLTQPVEATGDLSFILFAASDKPDTDWVVKLEDVYPDGRAMLVMDLILKARHRLGMEREDLLVPGQVYRFDIKLWDTSITFPAGHRIRVALASSNYPRFEVNPQTGEPFKQHTHTEVAQNRIQHNAAYPSRLLLSVVDPSALQGCRPATPVSGLHVERQGDGRIRLSWPPVSDACHHRYRVFAGLTSPQWPWIVRRPVAETTGTELVTDDPGMFWQVISEGTDGGNGPR